MHIKGITKVDLGKKIRVVSVPKPVVAPLFTPVPTPTTVPATPELVPLRREANS